MIKGLDTLFGVNILYGILLAQGFVLKNLLFLENGFDGVKCYIFKVLGFALRGVA